MGDFRVREILNNAERAKMYRSAINDIEALEIMLKENMFDASHPKIGAEQELCIVNKSYEPANLALEILDKIDLHKYTHELALFNLEINLDPHDLKDTCFSDMEEELLEAMQLGRDVAKTFDAEIIMTGILPTLKYRHLSFDNMTPVKRYRTLSQSLSDLRGQKFEIYLQGVDDLMLSLDSVLFEACNTSFQLHLQIHQDEFVDKHNWSQMIAGPILAACANSPLLFANELWAETRVALFKQSLDTRSSTKYLRKKLPRVYFGGDWIRESAADLWRSDLMRFPLLLTSDDLEDSKAQLKEGKAPDLRSIRLHNGTTYTWNRLCYGKPANNPHLRIECRYLPAGPSAKDEIANLALWIGVMCSEPPNGVEFWRDIDFKIAKSNFIRAARTGIDTVFNWYGKEIPADQLLINVLLPMARKGLAAIGVSSDEIDKQLGIIESRVAKKITGAKWMIQNYRKLSHDHSQLSVLRNLVRESLNYQKENVPVHEWEVVKNVSAIYSQKGLTVEQIMSNDIIVVEEHSSLQFIDKTMEWNKIHHLPVEDQRGSLVGLITDGMIKRLPSSSENKIAKEFMVKELVTVQSDDLVGTAVAKMKKHRLKGLPVVYKDKLVGIVTVTDLEKLENIN